MFAITVAVCAVLGLVIGSFLNVVIHRVPAGASVVRPRSHCPECDAPIRPRDEVPVLSWMALRGRCRDCSAPISARYPAVELLTAAVFAAVAARFAPGSDDGWHSLPAFLYLAAVGIALAAIDLDTKRLPNVLVFPSYAVGGALLGLAAILGDGTTPLVRAVLGMVAMYAVYFVLWFAVPGGMGFGDVKLAGVLGLYLGWLGWATLGVGLLAGWFAGGLVGVLLMVFGKAGRKTAVPFGPFMIFGALFAVLAGGPVARLWLSS